jgi:glycosyltransferase involved in cell wall biosynthesis
VLPKILITLPALNEAKFIGQVLQEISATVPNIPILVVNDGSTDDTSKVVVNYDVFLIEHQQNYGKGEAMKTAFSFAQKSGFDWIVFLDGDGQHPPQYLPDFIEIINNNRVDVILGNRQSRKNDMPFHRQLSNGITSILISLCAGQRILDSQCGFRAVRVEKMRNIPLAASGFQVESEMLIKLGKTGATCAHVQIETIYGDEASSINLVADTLKFIKVILKSLWW